MTNEQCWPIFVLSGVLGTKQVGMTKLEMIWPEVNDDELATQWDLILSSRLRRWEAYVVRFRSQGVGCGTSACVCELAD